jgi:hypothetical protein
MYPVDLTSFKTEFYYTSLASLACSFKLDRAVGLKCWVFDTREAHTSNAYILFKACILTSFYVNLLNVPCMQIASILGAVAERIVDNFGL